MSSSKRKASGPASCRFFTAEDAARWALMAYYGAANGLVPPAGEPWEVDGQPWASPASFGEAVVTRFIGLVVAAAIDARIPCDHGCATPSFEWDDRGFPGSHADWVAVHFPGLEVNDLPGTPQAPQNEAPQGVPHG